MTNLPHEDGYELWLRYRAVTNGERLAEYRAALQHVTLLDESVSATPLALEMIRSLPRLLDVELRIQTIQSMQPQLVPGALLVGTLPALQAAGVPLAAEETTRLGEEGYLIWSLPVEGGSYRVIGSNRATALLTGFFHLLRLLQTEQPLTELKIVSVPRIRKRILAHWDNLDGSIERGYAGRSLWQWDALPDQLDPRYTDYARACASIGINGVCLNNVNARAQSLTPDYLIKAAALADIFRPFGIRIYLAPTFSAPITLGGLDTADLRNPAVVAWWQAKVDEIYSLIPDFGGFQIKANSEGQPGPRDYGANHAEGARVLADALAKYRGTLLWRAFVYDVTINEDRANCANIEFEPLDGQFAPNVFVQVKNGAVDFQPREPFHPLFGAMEQTQLALEVQITQEYLGQSRHLVYLAGMWKEVLESDTYARGIGSTVAKVVDGTLYGREDSCIVGVANTGSDRNWCGHHFSQANWYAFGRLAWDHQLDEGTLTQEWIRLTWGNDQQLLSTLLPMMLNSWEACINYMTPLCLHHLMVEGHHYGPDPGFNHAPRKDWNNVYYHRADAQGVGYPRNSRGSNHTSQYRSPLCEQFDGLESCPEKFLFWFHHVAWDQQLASGRTLWEELQVRYQAGVEFIEALAQSWQGLADKVDSQRHKHVSQRLAHQVENAKEWQDVCLRYFGQFAITGHKQTQNNV
ncbi:MAG: alpha-glucuronidase family glycosyl hydrolase [Caldilineaceae bacterium]